MRRAILSSYISMVAIAVVVNAPPVCLTSIKAEPGLTDSQGGALLSALFWGFALTILITGPLADRFGVKPFLLSASLLQIAGLAAYAMRKAGSEWEWSFTGGNEIASGYRTGMAAGACTPATRRALQHGEPLTVDLHAMFKLGLGDHAHNYFIGKAICQRVNGPSSWPLLDDYPHRRYSRAVNIV